MSFIKRNNLNDMKFLEAMYSEDINRILSKIKTPIVSLQSINNLTKYKGSDPLGYKKIKIRINRLNEFIVLLKKIYLLQNKTKEMYKDRKIIKIIVTKHTKIIFIFEK